MLAPTLAIVDDDQDFSAFLAQIARSRGFDTHRFHSVADACPWLAQHDTDLTMLDMALPDGTGLDVIARMPNGHSGQIVFVSGTEDREEIRRAVATPATRFIGKPLRPDELDQLLRQTLSQFELRQHARQAQSHLLVGHSDVMDSVREDIARVAPTALSVLITGETGTGKELAARAIHAQSGRAGKLVCVNCGAIPGELLGSQLFGHERGAFTGANARHLGVFEQAQGGTLFLDEIGDMPASLQVYLLRVLETGHLVRLGGIAEIPVDVRIVAATHRAGGPEGGLRSDLYYRLARYPITLPPLRARGRDIGLLAQRFVEAMNRETGNSKVLASDCITALEQYSWPGNVRELRAATEYAYLRQEGREVHVMPMQRLPEVTDTDELRFQVGMTFQEVQDRLLDRTLAFHQGDKTAAARSLGVSVRTIHNHLARRRSC